MFFLMTNKSIKSLFDRLFMFYHDNNHMSIESDIDELTTLTPDALRVIIEYLEETEPHAVNTIDALKSTADYLEAMNVENNEEYWALRKRLIPNE